MWIYISYPLNSQVFRSRRTIFKGLNLKNNTQRVCLDGLLDLKSESNVIINEIYEGLGRDRCILYVGGREIIFVWKIDSHVLKHVCKFS